MDEFSDAPPARCPRRWWVVDYRCTVAGAQIVDDRSAAFQADVVVAVRIAGADPDSIESDIKLARSGQAVIGTCDPLGQAQAVAAMDRL